MARLPVKELYTPPTTTKTLWGKYGVFPDEQPKTSIMSNPDDLGLTPRRVLR